MPVELQLVNHGLGEALSMVHRYAEAGTRWGKVRVRVRVGVRGKVKVKVKVKLRAGFGVAESVLCSKR